jgi:hypothetical protein
MMNRLAEAKCKPALAHVRRNDDGSCAIHPLEDHVRAVGSKAAEVRKATRVRRGDLTSSWRSSLRGASGYYLTLGASEGEMISLRETGILQRQELSGNLAFWGCVGWSRHRNERALSNV